MLELLDPLSNSLYLLLFLFPNFLPFFTQFSGKVSRLYLLTSLLDFFKVFYQINFKELLFTNVTF